MSKLTKPSPSHTPYTPSHTPCTRSHTPYTRSHSAVMGLQYGDEGKGQLVDILAAQHDIVVRYNGGANAGHTVAIGNEKFVLHQVPIGCLTPNRINVLCNGVVVSAPALLTEMAQLQSAGIDLANLKVSERAHLVMPYHYVEEQLRHELTCQTLSEAQTLGTTFKGMGPCYADKASRDTGLRICDLYDETLLADRLKLIVQLKNITLGAMAESVGKSFAPFKLEQLLEECAAWAKALAPYIIDSSAFLNQMEAEGKTILFEGANAARLDLDFGTYPYVTSSNGSTLGIASGSGLLPTALDYRYGVAKTYMSRVGTGPFVTELAEQQAENIRAIGAEYGSTTERPRRIGWLDLPALRETVRQNKINRLVLTGLSILAQLPEFKVCTAYTSKGKTLTVLPTLSNQLEAVAAEYQTFVVSGELNQEDKLPEWCETLVALISREVCPVAAICTGKRRDQILWLD